MKTKLADDNRVGTLNDYFDGGAAGIVCSLVMVRAMRMPLSLVGVARAIVAMRRFISPPVLLVHDPLVVMGLIIGFTDPVMTPVENVGRVTKRDPR